MADQKKYQLVFLFEVETGDALNASVKEALAKELPALSVQIEPLGSSTLKLTLSGDRKTIDSAHSKLSKDICSAHPSIRLTDELGEDLRSEAYQILSKVEPRLRSFICEAMTNTLGFSWWDKLADGAIKERVAEVETKNRKTSLQHHPIEFSEFEHLVKIITGELAHWDDDHPITATELLSLLEGTPDLSGLKAKLQKGVAAASLWDTVFAKLFKDEQIWAAAKKDLTEVIIPARHKVSHHRPLRLFELTALNEAAERVLKALGQESRKLEPTEKKELKDKAEDLLTRVRERSSPTVSPLMRRALGVQSAALFGDVTGFREKLKNALQTLDSSQQKMLKQVREQIDLQKLNIPDVNRDSLKQIQREMDFSKKLAALSPPKGLLQQIELEQTLRKLAGTSSPVYQEFLRQQEIQDSIAGPLQPLVQAAEPTDLTERDESVAGTSQPLTDESKEQRQPPTPSENPEQAKPPKE